MNLTEEQIERYSRQIILKEIGGLGQEKLLQSKVLIIGAGGLGAPAALYLTAAGIGTLGIVDSDKVELSNLQRQIIHFTGDLNKSKVISAKNKLEQLNPDIQINLFYERITANNIYDIIREYDFIIDGTDNFSTKFLINDVCVLNNKAFSHGGILRYEGQTITYTPDNTCYRCIFDTPPPKGMVPTCSEAGILGAIAGMLGTTQAAEAIKYLLGIGNLLTNRLLLFNAFTMEFRTIKLKKNPNCPVCGENTKITELIDYEQTVCDLIK